MTEKRFTYHTDGCLMEWISDSKDGERVSPKCATEWLNILYEENEQLKSENKNLKSNVDDLMNMELEDRDIVCQAGKFRLEEWGEHRLHQFYDDDTPLEDETVVIRLRDLTKENEQLKQEYQKLEHRHSLLHDVCLDAECDRDRYHNDVMSLEKENEQLRREKGKLEVEIEVLSDELAQAKAVINKEWSEYLKKSGELE